jgi:hypothetical protein
MMKNCVPATVLIALVALASSALPLVNAQMTYNGLFFLKHFYGSYCSVDRESYSQPMRCDQDVIAVTLVRLTGNNSPFILNSSHINDRSVSAIFDGGAGSWCSCGEDGALYCDGSSKPPFFSITKRYDLPGQGGPYLWTGNFFEITYQPRSLSTGLPTRDQLWCGKEASESIVHCDYTSGGIDQTAFQMIYG